jgi:integrase
LEKPTGRFKSFRIRYCSPDTQNKWTLLSLPEIDTANQLLKSGAVDAEHTKAKLNLILKQQYQIRDREKKKAPFMTKNLELVERMWESKYPLRKQRRMKKPLESKRDLVNAAEACGLYPLDTCRLEDLEDYLDSTLKNKPNILARRIVWINSILSWLGRPKIESLANRQRKEVKYITEADLKLLLPLLPDRFCQLLIEIAFYTGLRLGEIFYLQSKHIRDNYLVVEGQIKYSKKVDTTKTNQSRDAILAPQVKAVLSAWTKIPLDEREQHRLRSFTHILKHRCQKLFPKEPLKHLNFHALRHSNAIWLLQKGVTLYEVAQHLGNHYTVTERYYSGFELKKESISRIAKIL